jgi:AAA+ superfamily predicted ATPase
MRRVFRAGSSSQFLLHGNVTDLVPAPAPSGEGGIRFVSLRRFLTEVMFEPFDVVIHYDRGRGIRVKKGGDHVHAFLKAFDSFRGTAWAGLPGDSVETLDLANQLPRDAKRALELLDRFIRASQLRLDTAEDGSRVRAPLKVALVIDHVQFIAPQGEALHLSGDHSQTLIRLLDWASDPAVTGAYVATALVSENLTDLNRRLVETPYSSKIKISLPTADEIRDYVHHLTADQEDFESVCEVSRDVLAGKLVGLSRVNVRSLLLRALDGGDKVTSRYLTDVKKKLIEKEAFGRIGFIEPRRTLDDVAGHVEAKAWLRQDAALLKKGRRRAIPMGYLLCGRIGTGKTYLVECWAGEVGIPVVEIKNFRERWVGATEGNLERIFSILHALGQVVVFVDEADQATGKRDAGSGDSGLSGRIYGMLAQEMSDTNNRGKIVWVFATSRPDLLEVDLKRQGRLDVHIPLFPPSDPESRQELFFAMSRKVGIDLPIEELPRLPDDVDLGGNEMEGILVRALRLHETRPESDAQKTIADAITEAITDMRPSAHVDRLELMDLLAVKECTDTRFLPERFRHLDSAAINRRIGELRLLTGE